MTSWAISTIPGVPILLDLLLFATGIFQELLLFVIGIFQQLWQYSLTSAKRSLTLTSTVHPTYSSIDEARGQEMIETPIDHTLVNIRPMPMPVLENRPSTIPFVSYAPSVWSVDNRILGQLKQLEQAQSYLFRSIHILIDNQEGLDEVEEFVEALSWESDLKDISEANKNLA